MCTVKLNLLPVKHGLHGLARALSSYTIERRNRITIITIQIVGLTIIIEVPP